MQALSTIISQNNRQPIDEIKNKLNNGLFVVVRKTGQGSIKSHTSHFTLAEAEEKKASVLASIADDYRTLKLHPLYDNDTVSILTH